MPVYAVPNTDNWVIADKLTSDLKSEGYVPMSGYPPALSIDQKLEGKIYVANDIGEWVIQKDPRYLTKINKFIKKIFGSSTVTPAMYKKLAERFDKLSKEVK